MVRRAIGWEMELDDLLGLRKNNWAKALWLLVAVLAFLILSSIFAQPARADLVDEVVDQSEIAEAPSSTPSDSTADNTEPQDDADASPVSEESEAPVTVAPAFDLITIADEAIESIDTDPSATSESIELAEVVPSTLDEVAAVIDDVPVVEEVLETVEEVVPVEIVEEVSPIVEQVESVFDAAVSAAPSLVDGPVVPGVGVLTGAILESVESPAPVDPRRDPVPHASPEPPMVTLGPETIPPSRPTSDLLSRQLIVEMSQFQLAESTDGTAGNHSPASPAPHRETASMAGYVPVAGTVPNTDRGPSASGSGGFGQSGTGFLGGIDASSFLAALAALLALCVVGWIRDRSRSGQSIFPSHGGRPG